MSDIERLAVALHESGFVVCQPDRQMCAGHIPDALWLVAFLRTAERLEDDATRWRGPSVEEWVARFVLSG